MRDGPVGRALRGRRKRPLRLFVGNCEVFLVSPERDAVARVHFLRTEAPHCALASSRHQPLTREYRVRSTAERECLGAMPVVASRNKLRQARPHALRCGREAIRVRPLVRWATSGQRLRDAGDQSNRGTRRRRHVIGIRVQSLYAPRRRCDSIGCLRHRCSAGSGAGAAELTRYAPCPRHQSPPSIWFRGESCSAAADSCSPSRTMTPPSSKSTIRSVRASSPGAFCPIEWSSASQNATPNTM
jgi:hypothetical protein